MSLNGPGQGGAGSLEKDITLQLAEKGGQVGSVRFIVRKTGHKMVHYGHM